MMGAQPLADRRQEVVSAVLVGAVVVVLGWGAGLGHRITHELTGATAPVAPASTPELPATVDQPATVTPVEQDLGSVVGSPVEPVTSTATATHPVTSTKAVTKPTVTKPTTKPTTKTTATTPPTTSATPITAPVTQVAASQSCTDLVDAVESPLWTHLEHGHLDESPAQQVNDILDLDQYVKTHTVLVESMVDPLQALLPAAIDAASTFWTHLQHGHLDESPAQQVNDILDTDQYVKTHTVLVEDMANPTVGVVTGSSC